MPRDVRRRVVRSQQRRRILAGQVVTPRRVHFLPLPPRRPWWVRAGRAVARAVGVVLGWR